jgi:hypothetical protein
MQPGATPPPAMPMGSMPPSGPVAITRPQDPQFEPPSLSAITKLSPGSTLHQEVLDKLEAMFKFGKDEMQKQYDRWRFGEQKIEAYCAIEDYKRLVDSLGETNARPPEPIQVVVPYSYATLHAAATFVANVLLGQKPVFPLVATRGTETDRARNMETAIQSHLDASRGYEQLFQQIWDSLIYGFGSCRCLWEERTGQTIRWISGQRQTSVETTFAGNVLSSIDPYSFVPDPRVPIHECNVRGDFLFTEMQQSETTLKDMQKLGKVKWVDEALKKAETNRAKGPAVLENRRRIKIGIRGEMLVTPANVTGFATVYEGTVRLIPKDWKLADTDSSEIWKFTWLKGQIIQAEPLGMIHNQHPYVASEPTTFGHDFMSIAMSDMIGPFQDIMSWLISSRMENVRTAINNQFVADPSRVEVNDIRTSAIGRVIRLKQQAMGLPVKEAIMQLIVQDVTMGHLQDIQTMRILADTITGVNDNMRGIQNPGGRKSATEARMSMQAGAGRLSQIAIRTSAQSMLPLANQMILNIQQFMPDKMWVEMTGDAQVPSSQMLTPEMLVGSFNYQISDGSLPYDKTALVEVWQQILLGIMKDPQLRQQFDIGKIFEYTAMLGGAKNIDAFKAPPPPPMPPAPMGGPPGLPPPGPPTLGGLPVQMGAAMNPGARPGMMPMGSASPAAPLFQPR